MPLSDGLFVKDTFEFVEKVKNTYKGPNDILASFDVKSLYPSIPVDEELELLQVWLNEQELSEDKKFMYHEMASVCMSQNYFQFNSKYYEQTHGTANLFLSSFETRLKKANLLPKIWIRYVDDIFEEN
jgi:hypothetical protein